MCQSVSKKKKHRKKIDRDLLQVNKKISKKSFLFIYYNYQTSSHKLDVNKLMQGLIKDVSLLIHKKNFLKKSKLINK